MKVRSILLLAMSAMLVLGGCGSDGGGGGDNDKAKPKDEKPEKKEDDKQTHAERVKEAKKDALADAKKAYEKDSDNVDACRDLAMKYISIASPESTGDPKKAPKLPKNREENLEKAKETLEECRKLDADNEAVLQMLASTYMATNEYDKASTLLERLARDAEGGQRANAYYAWGLAASNAKDYDSAIQAWTRFVEVAPEDDPRVAQVRQSIKALRQASKTPQKQSAGEPAGGDEAGEGDDEGGDS